jgi:DNA-binding NarL/FixJ family response regulator
MDAPVVAAALAGRAIEAFTARGARHDAARAIELRQRNESRCEVAGPLLTDTAPAAPVALSPREREVARLASTGLSNREIAGQLCVSLRTVENHLHRAFTKLGVRRRTDLATVFGA